jgi:L-lactate dehydrogenase complex protein LldG
MSSARDNILSRLHSTSSNTAKTLPPTFFFNPPTTDLQTVFAAHFSALGGTMHLLDTWEQLPELTNELCKKYSWQHFFCPEDRLKAYFSTYNAGFGFTPDAHLADASLTSCHALIAQYGSILVSSQQTRKASILPPVHIAVATASQLVFSLSAALPTNNTINTASIWSIITGASRTADIEKTLVMGAHGPKSLHLILISSL